MQRETRRANRTRKEKNYNRGTDDLEEIDLESEEQLAKLETIKPFFKEHQASGAVSYEVHKEKSPLILV